MGITERQLAEERILAGKPAIDLIGKNYYDQEPLDQAAIQRAKQRRVVWIDANGVIRKERRGQ